MKSLHFCAALFDRFGETVENASDKIEKYSCKLKNNFRKSHNDFIDAK